LKATEAIEDGKRGQLKPLKEDALYEYGFDRENYRESINKKHTAGRDGNKQSSNMDLIGKNVTSAADASCETQIIAAGPSSRLSETMKSGFQNFKSYIGAKSFIPLSLQVQENKLDSHVSSPESLDEIFQRLKQPPVNHRGYGEDDYDDYLYGHGMDIRKMGPSK
jgi:hypothetical protein